MCKSESGWSGQKEMFMKALQNTWGSFLYCKVCQFAKNSKWIMTALEGPEAIDALVCCWEVGNRYRPCEEMSDYMNQKCKHVHSFWHTNPTSACPQKIEKPTNI